MEKKANKIQQLLDELCTDGVEVKRLGDCLQRTKGTPITAKMMSSLNKQNGPIKLFAGGRTVAFVDYGDIPDEHINTKESVVVKSRGFIGFEYVNQPFSHKNELWSYHSNDPNVNIKYVYYYLKNNEQYFQNKANEKTKIPQISIPVTDNFPIPLPPIAVQEEIVPILDKFTELIDLLEKERELRIKQYEYYREKLLTPIEQDGNWVLNGKPVEWKKLGEVISLEYGKGLKEVERLGGEYPVLGSNGIVGYHNSFLVEGPSIIVGRKGSAGAIVWEDKNCYPIDTTYYVKILKKEVILRYLYHFFKFRGLKTEKQSAGVPGLNRNDVYKIPIPIPPLEEQERIVGILDKFDALVNDLKVGIPAEIELRRKQYEYYREKLLTFKLKES